MKIPRMIKSIAPVATSLRSAALRWYARRALYRLRFTSRCILIDVRNNASGGSSLYHIPRSRQLQVVCRPPLVTFSGASSDQTIDVPFASPEDAVRAMNQIARRVFSNRPLIWASRIVGLAVCWLLVSSYIHVKDRENAAVTQAPAASPTEPALAPLPDVSSPFQALPSSPAPIGSGDMAITQPSAAMMPSSPAAISAPSPTDGLAGFGLSMGPATPPPSVQPSAAPLASPGSLSVGVAGGEPQAAIAGPGCDPNLAFKAPAY